MPDRVCLGGSRGIALGQRLMLVHHYLARRVEQAVQEAQAPGELSSFDIPDVRIEHPRQTNHGDYATPIPLELARLARVAPVEIASIIAKYLAQLDHIDQVEISPPGFVNFRLSNTWLQQLVDRILTKGGQFGNIDLGRNRKAQVEFVSANPTGPITLARTRGGVIGDTLANVLEAVVLKHA